MSSDYGSRKDVSPEEAASTRTIELDLHLVTDGFPFVVFCDGTRSIYATSAQAAYGMGGDGALVFRTTTLGAPLEPVASDGTGEDWVMDELAWCVDEHLPHGRNENMRVLTDDEDEDEDPFAAAFDPTNTQCADVD